ncbi:MAG: zinc-binding dehydrogenase, partial [Candidatus Heimdallarchaeota archaeon]|nr:zinc-binding dehydrogenase [Candidatus Heimdallarchaeota archaeon]MCK4877171.1 zinc-binding dehydrogenase [Candidatus Heimdallarchaeota archaeon]
MKAVQLIEIDKDLENREVPTPTPKPDEVLLKIKAAGICHSDVHYRDGVSSVGFLPISLGHEVAGEIEKLGSNVIDFEVGDRICLNYMITCGKCKYCVQGTEQFCVKGKMIGKDVDGGYAEYIAIPTRGLFKLPDSVSFEHASVMMCSSSTSLHALRKTRFKPGETIAIFGLGGLGISALQLAKASEAKEIYAVDIDAGKLDIAKEMGAIPVNAENVDPVEKIMELTNGDGVDVALELIGLPLTMDQGVRSLARFGRLGLVGITADTFDINSYEVICREKEIIGVSDHLLSELPFLLDLAEQGKLDLTKVVTNIVPLEAEAINEIHHQLKEFKAEFRTV